MSLAHLAAQSRRLFCVLLVLGIAIANTPQGVRADYVINSFDSADEVAAWAFEGWSSAAATATWDPTVDSLENPASGSMKIEIDFDAAGGKNDANFTRALPAPLNATPAFLFIADIRVAEESPDTPWGDEGYMQIVGRNGNDWTWAPQIADNINSDGTWVAFDKVPAAPFDDLRAITFQLWGGGAQSLQGKTTIWLDNIQFLGDFPEPGQEGDTNGDGVVSIEDLNNVRNNFGAPNPPIGDTNGDGEVTIIDLNNVRNNFGAGSPVGVPEPASAALVLCGLASVWLARRRLSVR
jgi:hypothetical protein